MMARPWRSGRQRPRPDLEAWPALAERAPLLTQALPLLGYVQTRRPGHGVRLHRLRRPQRGAAAVSCDAGRRRGAAFPAQGRGHCRLPSSRPGCCPPHAGRDEMVRRCASLPPSRAPATPLPNFARRHGDFAVVAIAAIARANGIRIGVGGAAEQPVVHDWPLLAGSALDDALNALAWSLDAADDVHRQPPATGASWYAAWANRRLAQPWRRGHEAARPGEPPSGRPHPQRPRGRRAGPSPRTLLSDFLRPRARRHRHPCGVRARHLRRLHGASRRRPGARLPHARGPGRRAGAWTRWKGLGAGR